MPTQEKTISTTGDVQRAFRLGWRFAQLYNDPHRATLDSDSDPRATGNDQLPPHLPPLSGLSPQNQCELILREIEHDIGSLKPELATDDDADPASLNALSTVMRGNINALGKKRQILDTFRQLRIGVGADDPHLGTAIDLGRLLADTVILSNSPDAHLTTFEAYRIKNAYEWLEELHTSFPAHASDAVKGSLEFWEHWADTAGGAVPASQERRVRRSLGLQGERWRQLLSGEILPDDLLTIDNYRQAASAYLGRIGKLTLDFVRRFWPAIALVLAGTGALIWTILTYATGAASVAAVIATAAGSLGVSWKTVGSTLGKVAAHAEQPLWNSEVLEAIVMAALIPPVEMNSRQMAKLFKKKGEPKALFATSDGDHELTGSPVTVSAKPAENLAGIGS